jgi:hypothetical protein
MDGRPSQALYCVHHQSLNVSPTPNPVELGAT